LKTRILISSLSWIDLDDGVIQSRLIAYASSQAHSSAERAALLGGVKVRLLETDEDYSLRGEILQRAIEEDRARVTGCYRFINGDVALTNLREQLTSSLR
jgi:histidine decarboxylase